MLVEAVGTPFGSEGAAPRADGERLFPASSRRAVWKPSVPAPPASDRRLLAIDFPKAFFRMLHAVLERKHARFSGLRLLEGLLEALHAGDEAIEALRNVVGAAIRLGQ